jgi:hypothetical protein
MGSKFYACQYQIDRGVGCPKWTRDGQDYCDDHEKCIGAVEAMQQEIVEVIKRAREK